MLRSKLLVYSVSIIVVRILHILQAKLWCFKSSLRWVGIALECEEASFLVHIVGNLLSLGILRVVSLAVDLLSTRIMCWHGHSLALSMELMVARLHVTLLRVGSPCIRIAVHLTLVRNERS